MKKILICSLVCFCSLTSLGIQAAPEKVYTFGVVPQQTASKLAKLWMPLLRAISAQSGVKLRFKTAPNIPTFEKRLIAGEYDFAYMNPYHYTIAHQKPGYQAIAKAKNKQIKGIIVVHKDSPINSIEELDKQTLVFPAPGAFAATLLPLGNFSKQGLDVQAKYVSSHDSVYHNIYQNTYPAGGGVMRTFKNIPESVQQNLRILWTSKGYTPHAIAHHPTVRQPVVDAVQQAMASLNERGIKAVKQLKMQGFVKADDKDWDDVRSLNITLLNHLIE
jgi:phosphonate transport system substrate-binding protein